MKASMADSPQNLLFVLSFSFALIPFFHINYMFLRGIMVTFFLVPLIILILPPSQIFSFTHLFGVFHCKSSTPNASLRLVILLREIESPFAPDHMPTRTIAASIGAFSAFTAVNSGKIISELSLQGANLLVYESSDKNERPTHHCASLSVCPHVITIFVFDKTTTNIGFLAPYRLICVVPA